MRALATALFLFVGPASLVAEGRSELDILRARCTEQERQIRTLEKEIEGLHSQLALERRRSRGVEPSAAPSSPLPSASAPSYTVKNGDTLSSIARRYRTSAPALMKENGIEDPTRLRVGQKLVLPSEAKVPAAAAAPKPKATPKAEVAKKTAPKPASQAATKTQKSNGYKVQRGDTLYGIARRHDMSIGSLRALNPKLKDKIIIGQSIAVNGTEKKRSAGLGSSRTLTIATKTSTPAPKPVVKKTIAKKPAAKPKSKPAPKPVVQKKEAAPKPSPVVQKKPEDNTPKAKETPAPEETRTPAPKTISSILVMEEISFGNFAEKHGTTPQQLNALNGWDFQGDLVLARGSEIYVPGQ